MHHHPIWNIDEFFFIGVAYVIAQLGEIKPREKVGPHFQMYSTPSSCLISLDSWSLVMDFLFLVLINRLTLCVYSYFARFPSVRSVQPSSISILYFVNVRAPPLIFPLFPVSCSKRSRSHFYRHTFTGHIFCQSGVFI